VQVPWIGVVQSAMSRDNGSRHDHTARTTHARHPSID
jgi:hypothetical protein